MIKDEKKYEIINTNGKKANSDEVSKGEGKKSGEKPVKPEKFKRFEWLDQFRGLVVVFFVISVVTWKLSRDLLQGQFPVAPVYYDHGWRLFDSYYSGSHKHDPALITIIDIGQQIFMFLVGFMQGFSYNKRKSRNDLKNARVHILTRFLGIMFLSFIDVVLLSGDITKPKDWAWEFLFYGTLANIAWGSLFAGIFTGLVESHDYRFFVGLSFLIVHAILYNFPSVREWESGWMRFPWNTLGHIGIAVIASAYAGWFFDEDLKPCKRGIKDRVLPVSAAMMVSNYLIDWLQWAQHHHVTFSLAVLAIGTSGFMVWIFYMFEKWELVFPGLTVMGKNMLLMFVLSLVVSEAYLPPVMNLIVKNRFYGFLLAGVIPILIMWAIAKILDRLNIKLKF